MNTEIDWRDRLLQRLNRRLHPGPPVVNAARDEEIVARSKAGVPLEALAKEHYLTRVRIYQICRKAYVKEHGTPPPRRPPPTLERNTEIYRRFVAGERPADLARAFKLSRGMISIIVWKRGRYEQERRTT